MIFIGKQLQRLSLLLSVVCLTTTNAIDEPPALGKYDKVRTQFDGVTFEDAVTYFHLEPEQSVTLPLASVYPVGQPVDFTFSFWFKTQDLHEQESLQFFQFESGVICYITDALSIMCDTPERQRLIVNVDSYLNGKWYFFNLAVTATGDAILSIKDKDSMLVADKSREFYFRQVPNRDWSVCFGACDQNVQGMNLGFNGSIREVVALNEVELGENSNRIRTYKPQIKGYYRFAGQVPRMFALDEFRETQVITSFNVAEAFERDMIPSDICPRSFKTGSLVNFQKEQMVSRAKFDKRLKEQRYAYTMSLTAFIDSDTCVTKSFLTAQNKDCNIVLIDDVFMLFFSDTGVARFHFFADKNYFESQSSGFFVPFNQWITIQMQMTQYDGYQIAVLDQDGDVLVNFSRNQNMHSQTPKNEYSLFSGLSGYVSRFIFTDKAYYLPKTLSGRLDDAAIIDVSFFDLETKRIPNNGMASGIQLALVPNNKIIPYYKVEFGQINDPYPAFDGVTCDDNHNTMILSTASSNFSFQTPSMSDWMSETSINFWLKLEDWGVLGNLKSTQTHSIFTMQSGSGFEQYWFIFFRGGELVIAPFGLNKLSEPVIIFSEFNKTNADDLGWWHLSCYYQFYAKVECTLHNQNLDITRFKSLLGQSDYFFPQYGLTATFGKTAVQTFPSAAQLLIKDVNYWNRKVMLPEVKVMRYQQVDPKNAVGLLIYFRLAQGVPKVFNFAEFNHNYTFDGTRPRFSQVTWKSDILVEQTVTYDERSTSLVLVDSYRYHNVCPLYTYLKDGFCYSVPVNQVRVSLFPLWNNTSSSLEWLFTLEQSSYITPQVQKELQVEWMTTDDSLQSILSRSSQNSQYKIVASDQLRNEADYQVMGSLTNAQSVFKKTGNVNFIPNKCHWFEIGSDSYTSYRLINSLPGTQDFVFQLGLRQNQKLDCKNFLFFDSFKSVDFEFVAMTDDDTFMVHQPKVNVSLVSPSNVSRRSGLGLPTTGPEVEKEARTAKDLVVVVTIPKGEQIKFPVWTDVKIMMSIDWTSSKFNTTVHTEQTLFQNAMYTIQFAPKDSYLITQVSQNYKFVQRSQTLILSANETTVFGLHPSQVKDQLAFDWICPQGMELLCEGQNGDTLYIPWSRISLVPLNFSTIYQFGADITWMTPMGANETRRQNIQVQWYNLQKPSFNITTNPKEILVTSRQQTEFAIKGNNFDASGDMSIYQIDWLISPDLLDQTAKATSNYGQKLTIDTGNWEENMQYTIICRLYFQDEPSINGTSVYNFRTSAPPKNGIVTIFPDHGYIGETFIISVDNYVDPVSLVFFNVYNSYDAEGTLKGAQLNNRTMPATMDYRYKALSEYPIIVEVQNTNGEKVIVILSPQIVAKPEVVCTTKEVCPEDEASNNSTNSTNGGRRLQNQTQTQNTTNSTNTTKPKNQTTTSNTTQPQSVQEKKPCKNVTTCVQPQFQFDAPVEEEPESAGSTQNETNNQSVPDANQTDSGNGTRRLSTDNICTLYTPTSDITEVMAAFDLTGEFCILDSILSKKTEQQVIEKLEQVADYSTEYRSDKIEIASVMFNLENAAEKDIESLVALDVDYDLNTEALLWQFPQQPAQDFYMQAIAVRTSSTQVVLRVIDSVSGQEYALKDLDGQAKLKFAITPSTYLPGQTVCQGLLNKKWQSDVCLTEIDIENQVASCLCGLTQGVTQIAFKNDMSLAEGESVEFPVEEVLVVPEFEGTSFFFMGIVSCVSFVGLLGSLIAWKFDRRDVTQSNELSGWKLNLVMAVAAKQNESVELVKLRQSDLTSTTSQISIISKVHPLFAPFTTNVANQSRLLRFTAYHLQVNLFMIACMVHFGPNYRVNDTMRQELFLDSTDVNAITFATIVGAVVLLPIISEPISWLLSNKRVVAVKALFVLGCLVVNFSTVLVAIWVCKNCPTANQLVLATSVFSGFFMATMGTNLLRAGLTAFAPISCLTTTHAKQLLKDLEAVAYIDLTKFKIVDETEMQSDRTKHVEISVLQNSDKQIFSENVEKRISILHDEQSSVPVHRSRKSVL